ncbi:MAG: hypothetical protein ABI091_00840 [Ferruginibacter sp.]
MKKVIFLSLFLIISALAVFAQKKENGTIYIEHPANKVVADFENAIVAGDSVKIAGFLTDEFKAYNGTSNVYAYKGLDKTAFVNRMLSYPRNLDYFKVEAVPGSYPDALEYKKDNKDGDIVVQDWNMVRGVEKVTGVKIDAATQRIYTINKNNKITRIISYDNSMVIDEIGASFTNRTNGKIYNHHANINSVRKMIYALEKGDLDKNLSFYSDSAKFSDINSEWGTSHGKAEEKVNQQNFLNAFEIKSIDMIGYPDYLEYEMNNGRSVLSWWNIHLVRKSDKKVIILPIHLNDDFDENGKIISEMFYYSETLLNKK